MSHESQVIVKMRKNVAELRFEIFIFTLKHRLNRPLYVRVDCGNNNGYLDRRTNRRVRRLILLSRPQLFHCLIVVCLFGGWYALQVGLVLLLHILFMLVSDFLSYGINQGQQY